MSAYPMKISSISMHQETKSYHLLLITGASGKTVFVRRWGKKGVFGEIKPELYYSENDGLRAWNRLERAKTSGGYRPEGGIKTISVGDKSGLRAAMGVSVWAKIGKAAINHLDPTIDTSAMREVDPPRIGEDGKLTGEDKPRAVDLTEALAAQKAAEQAEAARILSANPNFARF